MSGELVRAVNDVMTAVGYIQGTGRNKDQGYNYTSDEDLLRALQPAMAEHGLILVPVGMEWDHEQIATRSGSTQCRVNLTATYELRHAEGESMKVVTCGQGTDSLDKAIYKAQTGAYKYAVRAIYAVPTGDDAEKDHATKPEKATKPSHAVERAPSRSGTIKQFARPAPKEGATANAAGGEAQTVVGDTPEPPASMADQDINWDAAESDPAAESIAELVGVAIRDKATPDLPAIRTKVMALPKGYHRVGAERHYTAAVALLDAASLDTPAKRVRAVAAIQGLSDKCDYKQAALEAVGALGGDK